ncbi:MAG: ABC transporter substrate-binding protein [Adlercreutzia equolifaciens]
MLSFRKGRAHAPDFPPHLAVFLATKPWTPRARRLLLFQRFAEGEAATTTDGSTSGTDAAVGAATPHRGHRQGPVEIPTNPPDHRQRLHLGEFLAVDVKPVIASPYALNNPFLAGLCDGIEALNTTSAETSLEMIAEKQPDLIVTITEADYDKYAKIAPMVYIADGTRTDDNLFRYIADLVGKKDAAEAYIAELNDKVATVKDEITGIVGDRTVSIWRCGPRRSTPWAATSARGGSIPSMTCGG